MKNQRLGTWILVVSVLLAALLMPAGSLPSAALGKAQAGEARLFSDQGTIPFSSPRTISTWTQTDWSGGGQQNWTLGNRFHSASNMDYRSTMGQIGLVSDDTNGHLISSVFGAGTPALAFRYVGTLGVKERAYLADVQHLNYPSGLFIDGSDNLYVANERGHRLLKYRTTDGANLLSIGSAGFAEVNTDTFEYPKDVAVDTGGNIWVVDNHRITKFDSSGSYSQVFPDWDKNPWYGGDDNEHFDLPMGIALDSTGRLYVSDNGNHRVQVYSTTVTGTLVYSATIGVTGVSGSDNSHFNHPHRMAFDGSNRLYVADMDNHRIQRCTYTGGWSCVTFHGTGSPGSGADELDVPTGVGLDSSDNVYIADLANDRVKKCTSGGACSIFASDLIIPVDVAVDSAGNVYVSDVIIGFTVRKYNSSGAFQGVLAGVSGVPYVTDNSHFNQPAGLAVDGSGNLYLGTYRGYRLMKLDASGAAQWTVGTPGVFGDDNYHFGDWWDGIGNVALDASDNVYVADTGNHRLQVYDGNGSYVTTLGTYGSGHDQFNRPVGVDVGFNGNIYVADTDNHRIQVYNSSRAYVDTIGITGVAGADNNHLDEPLGVTVDGNGNLYVADCQNHRVQVFNSSRSYVRTLGTAGESGTDFSRFSCPSDVAVDTVGRIYVADRWNQRVQVFDSNGGYLTTIGGRWGSGTGMLREPTAVDVDIQGNVYVADSRNHRVQKFAPGVPGWRQVNVNGFGDRDSTGGGITLQVFGDHLYAGLGNPGGGQVWRTANGSSWTQITSNGFGNTDNGSIGLGTVFDDHLFVGTGNGETGCEVLRSSDGLAWTQVASDGLGDASNTGTGPMVVFDNYLYTATWNDSTGTEVWRTPDGTAWSQVNDDGFGDANNIGAISIVIFNNALYVGAQNFATGAELWRTFNGSDWQQVNDDGFGDPMNQWPSLAVYDVQLYVGTANDSTDTYIGTGTQIWRSVDGTSWTQAVGDGFGDATNGGSDTLTVFDGALYSGTYNGASGTQIRKTIDGTHWNKVAIDGFGDSNNYSTYGKAVFEGRLYLAAANEANGAEVWLLTGYQVHLPLLLKAAPLTYLRVKNETTGTVLHYTVHGTPQGDITCTNIPAGTTVFCGSFTPGTYQVSVDTTQCGASSGQVTFTPGSTTRVVSCQ